MARKRKEPITETRTYTNPGQWLNPQSQAGIYVTPETALTFSAVFAAINVISTDIASLPCILYKTDSEGGRQPDKEHPLYDILLYEPNIELDAFHFTQTLIGHVLRYGNGYAEILWDNEGFPRSLHILDPRLVRPKRNAQGALIYVIENGTTYGNATWLKPENIIHIKGLSHDGILGYSPVTQARQSIGLGIAQEIYGASFYGNNAVPSGFLKTTQNLKKEARQNKKEEFDREHGGTYNAFRAGVLTGDWEWISTSITPNDAQYLASREFSIIEIARWFNISPVKLRDYTNAHYNNIEQLEKDHVTSTLRPWIINYEYELNRKLLAKWERKSLVIRHDMSARLRGDEASRTAYYNSLFGIGAINRNDIRQGEDMPVVPGGEKYFVAANNYAVLGDDGLPQLATAATYFKQDPTKPDPSKDKPTEEPKADPSKPIEDNDHQAEDHQAAHRLDPEAVTAVRAVLVDAVGRLVRREATALKRAAKKADRAKVFEDFYQGHQDIATESLASVVAAYSTVSKRSLRVEDLVSGLVTDSIRQIESTEDFDGLLAAWEGSKAEDVISQWEESNG